MTEKKTGGKIASPVQRAFAIIIDLIFIGSLCRVFIVPLFLPAGWDRMDEGELLRDVLPAYLLGIILLMFRDVLGGVGPGKYFLNIRVAIPDPQLSSPSPVIHLKRNLALMILPVEAVVMVVNRHCRRLGDQWANTVVLIFGEVEGIRFFTKRILLFMIIMGFIWIGYLSTSGLTIRKTDYYKVAREDLLFSDKVSQTVGSIYSVGDITENRYLDPDRIFVKFDIVAGERNYVAEVTVLSGEKGSAVETLEIKAADE